MFSSTLINERPKQILDSTHVHLTTAIKLNEELAGYFRDRAQVEDVYVQSLNRLSKKHYIFNESSLGTFYPLWEALQQELFLSGKIHEEYSKKINETIELPLKQSVINDDVYHEIQSMEQTISKTAKEHEDLEQRIQKHKKAGSKGELKTAELIKQQESKSLEWQNNAPGYLEALQNLDEIRLGSMKESLKTFGILQGEIAEKTLQSGNAMLKVAETLSVENELSHFCSSVHQERRADVLSDHDSMVLEASHSESSLKQATGKKKRFFSSIVSIRRKPKNSATEPNRQRSFSHSDTLAEVESTSTAGHTKLQEPTVSPHLRKAASFSIANVAPQEPALIVVDSEGYSIPPTDRETLWPSDRCGSFVETEDMSSDAGSLFSNNTNPRIKVDIKNEAVVEEDASNAAVALTRVATLLKEKNMHPNPRRVRGRREVRATQLYSVMEQPNAVSPFEEEEPSHQQPEISVVMIEKVHVVSNDGQGETRVIEGEARLCYSGPTESANPVCFQLTFDGSLQLEAVSDAICEISPGVYQWVNLSSPTAVVKYQEAMHATVLSVKPIWKFDSEKTRLLIKYQKMSQHVLENVSFMTLIGKNVKHAQSIPTGELSSANDRIRWDLGCPDANEHVIKAQFEVSEQGNPQPVFVKFEIHDQILSSFRISTGEDVNTLWANIKKVNKQVKSGKYTVS
ncbi:hypothetical protein BY458DRAFT_525115 [Sporodiniella umbellata]|nr:hypothetical protein BY458DRAFT_525115 [Sporodiniella umbellata]